MNKLVRFIGFALVALLCTACHSFSADSARLQRQLDERIHYADKQTERLSNLLQRHIHTDSIRIVAEEDRHLLFYVFDATKMVYWSNNWLASDEVYLHTYDQWHYTRFKNAHTIAKWTQAGKHNILTVIPIRFAYPVQTSLLQNEFVEPFNISAKRGITRKQHPDYTPIVSNTGDFLFSLMPSTPSQDNTNGFSFTSESFSFQALLDSNDLHDDGMFWQSHSLRVRLYFILCIVFIASLFIIGLVGLVRHKGLRNMRLSTRFTYIILTCVLAIFIYLFVMAINYVHRNYEQRQKHDLLTRSEYIQSYLRTLYYWDLTLTPRQAHGLAIDLHDLGYDINQDIHVYSITGELLASSSESLFTSGVLSRRMAPEPLFSEKHEAVCYEYLANHPYLVSYVPFYNGSFVPIGYIATPYFLSEQTRNQEIDNMLARLLPPYLIILLLVILFSYMVARSMTAPIQMLTEKMSRFKIGTDHNHIDYPYHDELGALVARYNIMVERVEESAAQLAKAEREGAWQIMARQVAHEINNPLTPMKLTVQRLQRMYGTEQFDSYFEKAAPMLIEEIDNLAHIARSFSTFAKQPEVISSTVDVAQKLSNVITLQRANDEMIPIRYVGADQGVNVIADQEQISQVFVNILRNAIQATTGKEDADIIVMLNAAYSDSEIQISISDNGPGIPENVKPSIFRPNFTTKSNGNGLGLAISKRIVDGTGGRITFESSDKGTTFFVYLKKR